MLRASRSSFLVLLVLLFSPGGAAAREREVIRAARSAKLGALVAPWPVSVSASIPDSQVTRETSHRLVLLGSHFYHEVKAEHEASPSRCGDLEAHLRLLRATMLAINAAW